MRELLRRMRDLFAPRRECEKCAGEGKIEAENYMNPSLEGARITYPCTACRGSGKERSK